MINKTDVVILISAGAEWRALLPHYPQARLKSTPYGEYFTTTIANQNTTFLHGGWGKVAAAGSTQYAIDRWYPASLINIGTCGGFFSQIERGEIVCAEKTIIYDIVEQMSDSEGAVDHYAVDLDLSWLPTPPPQPVVRTTLVSADRDILPGDIPTLIEKYQAQAADWESGAIAWVAQRNQLPCLILRAVSDLVDGQSGEVYGNYALFEKQCEVIMTNFALNLSNWINAFTKPKH